MLKAIYILGQRYSLKENNQDKEIQRRIVAGWAAYAKHRDIFTSKLAICLKRQVYDSCVLPAMTYGAETRTLTKQTQNKLAAEQTTDGSRVSPLGDYTTRKEDTGELPRGGETPWTNMTTGATRYGRGQHTTG